MDKATAEMARRALGDRGFAQAVLDGAEGNDDVRAAILADLDGLEPEVAGFDASTAPAFGLTMVPTWGTQISNPNLTSLTQSSIETNSFGMGTSTPVGPGVSGGDGASRSGFSL
jgi:hypothetical protein